ncbi:hypothetical protein [Thermincola potens]|uniref:Uncharacterized protein n=1 Tax=Thermincola potens (strain JR) TaxID=635013 RepID=D5X8H0_THEPJ|nr:hypothetical protein [Thermincola potens]ADG82846.1 hypothetical protein TherJR_2001 [Thermincola potens JR]
MNIRDVIYFSPNYRMEDLDFDNRIQILSAFKDRIENYYFKPIQQLNSLHYAFGAGLILVSLVDALARYSSIEDNCGARIKHWLKNNVNLPYTKEEQEEIAKKFYNDFRCGLVHESHIKNSGQFSYDTWKAITYENGFLIINPEAFFSEIKEYFARFLADLKVNDELYKIFFKRIRKDFEAECIEFQNYYGRRKSKKKVNRADQT